MLKLHGSLNWLKCNNCGSFILLQNMISIPEFWNKNKTLPMQCPHCLVDHFLGLQRVIIPPTILKQYQDIEIRYLWKIAKIPKNVENIVVIGYSFSEQDPQIRMLLRTMIESGHLSSDIPILLINRKNRDSNIVKKRIKSIFTHSEITWQSPSDFFKFPDHEKG